MSEKEIGKFEAVKTLAGFLNEGREKIRLEKENLAQRKAKINEKIAKVDAKLIRTEINEKNLLE